MKRQFTLVLALIVLSATAAFAGTFQGVITDAAGNPIAGAQVTNYLDKNPDGSYKYVATSNADGTYSVQFDGNNPGFLVYHSSYAQPVRFQEDGIGSGSTVTQNWKLTPLSTGAVRVWDTFSSAGGSYGLGTTDDAAHYSWKARTAGASVADGVLNINHNNGVVIFDKSNGQYFKPGNVDLTATFKHDGAVSWQAILFRMPTAAGVVDYNASQAIFINPNGDIWVKGPVGYAPNQLQLRDGATQGALDLNVYHTWRVIANGYSVKLYMDGGLVADKSMISGISGEVAYLPWPPPSYPADVPDSFYWDTQVAGGFVGFQSFGTGTMMVDSINIAVPEPSAIIALLSGMVGLVGFARRRRA
jgi:hypothetical protein